MLDSTPNRRTLPCILIAGRAEVAKSHQQLSLLGDDDLTADRNYISEFVMACRGVPLHPSGSLGRRPRPARGKIRERAGHPNPVMSRVGVY